MDAQEAGKKLLEAADKANFEGRFDEAEKLYDELLTQNHDQPWLLATLGTLYLRTNRFGLAMVLLHQAAEKMKDNGEVLCNLGLAYKYAGQHERAQKWIEKSTNKKPTAETLTTLAGLHINVGTPEKALEIINRAIKLNPEYPLAHWNKSMALLEMGRWGEGWDENEWGFKSRMRIRRDLGAPYWDGTNGKTIAVYGEQGLGDEIMFSSMLPDLCKENTVILECHTRLENIFKKSFPELTVYGNRESKTAPWVKDHNLDYAVSIGSLGRWFRRSKEDFPGTPYLKAEPLEDRGTKLRVGISWTGGLKPGRVAVRTIPLSLWLPILNNDCEFVSLQYTDCHDEIESVNRLGYDIQERDDLVKAQDYYQTARLVRSCDLVISCATSVYHLAGALGVPTWLLAPNKPAWREQVRGTIPWYRSVRVYRQPQGDRETWRAVTSKVGYDLSEFLDHKRREAA
jgi:tetratricopeptide (TPR) repeat protein